MYCAVVDFLELVFCLSLQLDAFWLFSSKQSFSEVSVIFDVLLNCLVDRDIDKVVLDSQICAGGVHSKTLFMVD